MSQVPPTIGPVGHRDPPTDGRNVPLPHRTHRCGPSLTEGHVRHGRPGATRFTGTRAICSPRFVAAASRGGVHGRTWNRGHGSGLAAGDGSGAHGGGPAGDPLDLPAAPDEGPRT